MNYRHNDCTLQASGECHCAMHMHDDILPVIFSGIFVVELATNIIIKHVLQHIDLLWCVVRRIINNRVRFPY